MITTLEEIKKYLGITSSEQDDILTDLIEQCTALIEKITGKSFIEVLDYQEVISGCDEPCVNLKNYPLTRTTQRKLESSLGHSNKDDWQLVDENNYWVDEGAGIIKANFNFINGFDNYRFTYSYGYSEVPVDVKLASHLLIASFFGAKGKENIKGEKIGDYSITYSDAMDNDAFMKIINKYI